MMTIEEAYYLKNYFPRLMTPDERQVLKYHVGMVKLGLPEKYDSIEKYERRKKWFIDRNLISLNESEIILTGEEYDEFILNIGRRIEREHPNEYYMNRCSKCNFIARTPYARQCRKCGQNWHSEIKAKFSFVDFIKLTGQPQLWFIGEILEGEIQKKFRLDLSIFQINLFPKIDKIELVLRSVKKLKTDHLALGIIVNSKEENLIRKYIKKSARNILIIDRK